MALNVRTRYRLRVIAGALLLLLLTSPTPAAAHGDVVLVDGTVEIAPRSSMTFDGELHYHRLIARIDADAPVAVRLARASDGVVEVAEGPSDTIVLNRLVRCCHERTWTRYTLTIENPSDRPLAVRASARLVHDDLAIMAYQAESGTSESVAVFGVIWIALLWRGIRRRGPLAPLRRTAVALGVLVAAVGAAAVFGAVRYGVAGPPALVAAFSELPVLPVNPIVSRAALLLLVVLIAWSWVLARWAASSGRIAWSAVGLALIATVLVSTAAMISAYGERAIPLAFALAATVPIVAAAAVRLRRPAVA